MADKRQFLDVWIVETNTVYKQVPFTVVADWIQQGRLLEDDKVRQAGQKDWQRLAEVSALKAYLPKAEPFRAGDQAEALEPVAVDFSWKPPAGDDDEDVDMIPLIDVSLVLLIFFMMTASVASAVSLIATPAAREGANLTSDPGQVWIGIDRRADGEPEYSLGKGDQTPLPEDRNLTERQVLDHLAQQLKEGGRAEVRIKANKQLPYRIVKQMTLHVERLRPQVTKIYAEVSESAPR